MADDMRTQIIRKHWYVEEKVQQRTFGENRKISNQMLHKMSENTVVWKYLAWK